MTITSAIADAVDVARGRWRWRKATTLTDLANLQASRIARRLTDPGIDKDQMAMYFTLVALGRAGVVVHDWRPGTSNYLFGEDSVLDTRACVTGFADDETKDRLDDLLYYAGQEPGATKYVLTHVFELYAAGSREFDLYDGDERYCNPGSAWVERIDGTPTARIGGQMTAMQVYRAFPTNQDAEIDLQGAWQITICAHEWGKSAMWADLLRMLTANRRTVTAS